MLNPEWRRTSQLLAVAPDLLPDGSVERSHGLTAALLTTTERDQPVWELLSVVAVAQFL